MKATTSHSPVCVASAIGSIIVCVLPSVIYACPLIPLYQLRREIAKAPTTSDLRRDKEIVSGE